MQGGNFRMEKLNQELAKLGYTFNPDKFMTAWDEIPGSGASRATMKLFEIASVYIIMAYQFGADSERLESLFPFLEKKEAAV